MLKKEETSHDSKPNGSTNHENVRTKVSTWLVGIVEEVRRKNPTKIQKLSETNTSEQIVPPNKNILQQEGNEGFREENAQQDQLQTAWVKRSILSKFNRRCDDSGSNEDSTEAIGPFSSLGRVKINHFYDKVFLNKAHYNLLKSQKMDKPNTMLKDVEDKLSLASSGNREDNNPKLRTLRSEDSLDLSFDNDDFPSFSQKLNLGEICSASSTANDTISEAAKSSCYPTSPSKNIPLRNIGRSFSEQIDEDDEYMLNERSSSYSHVINNRVNKHLISVNNNSNVSTSLPSFFDNKSISHNPIMMKPIASGDTPLSESPRRGYLKRDSSVQSDSSHCSSVESLLEARKPDPEAILINLGFGPVESEDILSRIPKRFLKPSQVRGIDTEAFVRRQQLASHLHDHSVLGYRGLLGNPDIPPSRIVAKIMERFEMNERNRCILDIAMNRPQSAPPTPGPNT